MLCKNCGAQLSDQDLFCGCCGASTINDVRTPALDEPTKEPKKKKLWWLWICAVIALLAAVAVVLILFLLPDRDHDPISVKAQIIHKMTVKNYEDGQLHEQTYEIEYDGYELKRIAGFDNGELSSESLFDAEPKLPVSKTYYDEDGNIASYYSYKKGDLEEAYHYTDGKETTHTVCVYNADGSLAEEVIYEDGEQVASTTYKYNADGHVVEQSRFWQNGQEAHMTFEYDERENLVSSYTTVGNGYIYKYDDNDRLIEKIHTSYGKEDQKETYKYDDADNLLECVWYYEGEISSSTTYEYRYDKTGNLIKKIVYRNGEEESRTTYEYDIAGQLSSFKTDYSNGETIVMTLEYDVVHVAEETAENLNEIKDYVMGLL